MPQFLYNYLQLSESDDDSYWKKEHFKDVNFVSYIQHELKVWFPMNPNEITSFYTDFEHCIFL